MKDAIMRGRDSNYADAYRSISGDLEKKTKTVTFIVTEGCTLRCTYCYETNKNEKNIMTIETAKKAIDTMYKLDMEDSELFNDRISHGLVLDFIGGEPLMQSELIDEILEYFIYRGIILKHRWSQNYQANITTNGTEYFSDASQKLLEKYKGKLSLGITIDGNKDLHDACRMDINGNPSFDIVQKSFKDALEKGLTSTTKLTIAPKNLPFLSEAIKELLGYKGMMSISANPIFEYKWKFEDAKVYYDQLKDIADWFIEEKKYKTISTSLFEEFIGEFQPEAENNNWCGGTGGMLAVNYDGIIYPCNRYSALSLKFRGPEEFELGNEDDGWLTTEKSKAAFKKLQGITRKSQSTEECFTCEISSGCGWCSAWNHDLYGTPDKRSTAICNMHKARTMANVYYYNKIYRLEGLDKRKPLNIRDVWALDIISEEELDMLKNISKID